MSVIMIIIFSLSWEWGELCQLIQVFIKQIDVKFSIRIFYLCLSFNFKCDIPMEKIVSSLKCYINAHILCIWCNLLKMLLSQLHYVFICPFHNSWVNDFGIKRKIIYGRSYIHSIHISLNAHRGVWWTVTQT